MLILLTDGGLSMYQVNNGYIVDGVTYKDYDLARDVFFSMMNPNEEVVVRNDWYWKRMARVH